MKIKSNKVKIRRKQPIIGGNTVLKTDKTRVNKYINAMPQHVSGSLAGIFKQLFPVKTEKPPGEPNDAYDKTN